MTNLEQKFRCTDLGEARQRAMRLGAEDRGILQQHDLFFPAPQARLKLRVFGGGGTELIAYNRADSGLPRASDYHIAPVADAEAMIAVLTQSLGVPRSVRKTRRLLVWRATRIHLDEVDGLGTFVELETVITTQRMEEAQAELEAVVSALGLSDVVPVAYIDLLEGRRAT